MANRKPTVDDLRQLMRYDPEIGKLFWKERARKWFKSDRDMRALNTRIAGKEAFTSLDSKGYRQGKVLEFIFRAHRVAWAIETGVWPQGFIDHINGDRTDNTFSNLREATNAQNQWNSGAQVNNTSGFKGVSWRKRESVWVASISHKKEHHFLGCFNSAEAAHAAYCEAAARLHGEFARAL